MSKGVHDILAFVIKFLGVDQQPKHIIIKILEAIKTIEYHLTINLT
jgi:hypothetical protein